MRIRLTAVILLMGGTLGPGTMYGQNYPLKSIRLIAAGGNDFAARQLAQ